VADVEDSTFDRPARRTWILAFAAGIGFMWLCYILLVGVTSMGDSDYCRSLTCEGDKARYFYYTRAVYGLAFWIELAATVLAVGCLWRTRLIPAVLAVSGTAAVIVAIAAPEPWAGFGLWMAGIALLPVVALAWFRLLYLRGAYPRLPRLAGLTNR
jgi:hypothetical protein